MRVGKSRVARVKSELKGQNLSQQGKTRVKTKNEFDACVHKQNASLNRKKQVEMVKCNSEGQIEGKNSKIQANTAKCLIDPQIPTERATLALKQQTELKLAPN